MLQRQIVELTPSQITSLKENQPIIIVAPGPGKMATVTGFVAQYKFNTTPYTVPQNVEARFFYQGHNEVGDSTVTVQIDQLLTPNVNTVQQGVAENLLDSQTAFDNIPILFGIFNDLGPVTDVSGGDGNLILTVYYVVTDLE